MSWGTEKTPGVQKMTGNGGDHVLCTTVYNSFIYLFINIYKINMNTPRVVDRSTTRSNQVNEPYKVAVYVKQLNKQYFEY